MITNLKDFLAEQKRLASVNKINENETNTESTVEPGAQATGAKPEGDASAEDKAAETKAVVDEVATMLGINPAELETSITDTLAAVQEGKTTKVNESFIDTIINAFQTFGHEIGNFQTMSFSSGAIVGLIISSAVALLWFGSSAVANKQVKKALNAYINFKFKNEMAGLTEDKVKDFIVAKIKELKANKSLMADIKARPDAYLAKYGKYVVAESATNEKKN